MSGLGSIGARIRDTRVSQGIRQAQLAQLVEISPSYLNLIEHDRRRIGGKLLLKFAEVLGVEVSILSAGAGAAIVGRLMEANASHGGNIEDAEASANDFASRFSDWADLLVGLDRQVRVLEQTVDTLTDRLAHDPHLAASLHEVLTTVTAIKSTSSILADTDEIEVEWQNRFHRNLNEDSSRLADSASALVDYLDGASRDQRTNSVPQEALEAAFETRGFHFPEIENDPRQIPALIKQLDLSQSAARHLAHAFFEQYCTDALEFPMEQVRVAVIQHGPDPIAIAQSYKLDLSLVMRRLAYLPEDMVGPIGFVSCDSSGSFLSRKPVRGFHIPRFGSACAIWPLFEAMLSPHRPILQRVTHTGREGGTFDVIALAQFPSGIPSHNTIVAQSSMLIIPVTEQQGNIPVRRIGAACRVCSIVECENRREPSILGEGF